jgi:hypothetical protein
MSKEIREKIVEVLNSAGVKYKESSRFFTIRCVNPSHPDKAGRDMKFYKDSGVAYCFACKTTLTIKDFAKQFNVPFSSPKEVSRKSKEIPGLSKYEGVSFPLGYSLWTGGHSPLHISKEMVSVFNIGYCNYGFDKKVDLRRCSGCPCSNWISSDGFCNFAQTRIMTPIVREGKLLSIESRDLSGLHDKKVVYPSNSRPSFTIFNYDKLDKSQPLYVVEGIKSCMRLYEGISKNSTAIFSNRLKGDQGSLIKQFKEVVLIPDVDRAGAETVKDFIDLRVENLGVVSLPTVSLCKNCKGEFKIDKSEVCPSCKEPSLSYKDAFDYTLRELDFYIKKRRIIRRRTIDNKLERVYNIRMMRGLDAFVKEDS